MDGSLERYQHDANNRINKYVRGLSLIALQTQDNQSLFYFQDAYGDVANLTNTVGDITKTYTFDVLVIKKHHNCHIQTILEILGSILIKNLVNYI